METILLRDGDPSWPSGLSDLEDPPAQLFVRGALPEPGRAAVGIVGSRHPSREALRFTRELAESLAAAGVVVVSGGALGIDGAAHEGALAVGGRTVAVLAGDVERPAPAAHRPLFRAIGRGGGALVAEYARVPPHRGAFITRNRLIAAWSRCLVVVEARLRSGTRSTALAARRLSRPVFAVPWSPYHAPGAGGLRLLAEGAEVLWDAAPVLARLGLSSAGRGAFELPAADRRLLDALARSRGASLDHLVELLALPLPRLLADLSRLELGGFVESEGAGRYRVSAPSV